MLECTTNPKFVMQYAVRDERLSPCLRRLSFEKDGGQGEMRLLEVYPGVQIWNIDFHMDDLDIQPIDAYHYLKLNYCLYGSCEVPLPGERYVYIGQGMVSMDSNPPVGVMRLPTGEYTGLEIVIDLEELCHGEPPGWADCGVDTCTVMQRLLDGQGSYLAPASREWAELAKQLYLHIQANDLTAEDCRFHLLRLLWMLKNESRGRAAQSRTYLTLGQREVVLRARDLLARDLRQRCTIADAAAQVGVSPASLKKYFATMFGMPISVYLRRLRVAAAKALLADETRSIADIASDVGYENQGKFGAVFRRETGVTPLEFRRRHRSNTDKKGERV